MKILHLPFTYHPDPVGGTEVYVAALARELTEFGVHSEIVAPGGVASTSMIDGIRVHRLAIAPLRSAGETYGEGDPQTAGAFESLLDREQPDLVHFHARSRGVSLRMLRAAKRRGIPVVVTCHTPGAVCANGTMLRAGAEVCDGRMDAVRCSQCMLQGKGLPEPVAGMLAHLPPRVGELSARSGFRGALATAVQIPWFMSELHRHTHEYFREADLVVAVCEWLRAALLVNGVPGSMIRLCRQGVALRREMKPLAAARVQGAPLRIAFLGRMDPIKGADLLLQAALAEPDLPLRLDLFGVPQGDAPAHADHLRALAASDPRIRLHEPVLPDQVVGLLCDYDLLAVPSRCLESGPLVVLEAFAAGIPVLANRLGGMGELVRDGVDGCLVDPVPAAWRAALRELATNPDRVSRMRDAVLFPRTMTDVAREMMAYYRSLLVA
jgi:glycosyltransferase involved in cell wall biosynthesis